MKVYAHDLLSDSDAQLPVDVDVIMDWRFRMGVFLARIAFRLMGCNGFELRYLPACDDDGNRPQVDPE